MDHGDLKALLDLIRITGLGPTRIRNLVRSLGSPREVFRASLHALCRVDRIDVKVAEKIVHFGPTSFAEAEIERAEKAKVRMITLWHEEYPFHLKKIYDPPVLIYVKGVLAEGDVDSVAVVGTRMPTAYGKKVAEDLAGRLASTGLTIVSGLAKGIDTIAHHSALDAGGRTIAVLGNGLDVVYPSENRKLLKRIETSGAVISEFPFGTKPDAMNFPRRNRIISGLSHATIVVEAGDRSGAILTALNAVDQNREVFAVPGRLTDSKSIGCLRLIRHGAIPVHDVQQILDILNPKLKSPTRPIQRKLKLDTTRDEMVVYSVVSDDPKHVDEIVEETKLDPSTVLTLLLSLELKGAVAQLSGKQFVRS